MAQLGFFPTTLCCSARIRTHVTSVCRVAPTFQRTLYRQNYNAVAFFLLPHRLTFCNWNRTIFVRYRAKPALLEHFKLLGHWNRAFKIWKRIFWLVGRSWKIFSLLMEITNLLNWNVKMDHCAKIRVELGFRNYGQFCGSGLIGIQEFFL